MEEEATYFINDGVRYTLKHKSSNLQLYMGTNNVCYAEWSGAPNRQAVRLGVHEQIHVLIEHSCELILTDLRKIKGNFSAMLPEVAQEFVPILEKVTLKKNAHIYPLDPEAIEGLNQHLEIPYPYESQAFVDFDSALNWLIGRQASKKKPKPSISLKTSKGLINIPFEDIYYISMHERKAIVQLLDKRYDVNYSLSELESILPPAQFMRVHKSHILNLDKISEIRYQPGGQYHAYLKDFGKVYLTIGRTKVKPLKDWMNII